MARGSDGSTRRQASRYRIAVRGELGQHFIEPLGQIEVETNGDESILTCDIVDQAMLQIVLTWLYARNVEILSVARDNGSA